MPLDADALAEQVFDAVNGYVEREIARQVVPLRERLATLEARLAEPPKERGVSDTDINRRGELIAIYSDGRTKNLGRIVGAKGKDAELPDIPALVRDEVTKQVALIPPAEPGKSVTVEDVAPLIVAEVEKRVAEIPRPKDGKSVDPEQIRGMVAEAVSAAVEPFEKRLDPIEQRQFVDAVLIGDIARKTAMEVVPEPVDLAPIHEQFAVLKTATDAVREAVECFEPPEVPDVRPMVDEAVKAAVSALEPPTDHASEIAVVREEVAAIKAQVDAIEIPDMPDAPDLSDFARKADVDALVQRVDQLPEPHDYGPQIDAVKADVAAVRSEIPAMQDLSDLAHKDAVAALSERLDALPDHGEAISTLAARVDAIKMPDPPDLSDLATKAEVEAVEAKIPTVPEPKDWTPEIESVRAEVVDVREDIPKPADLSDFARKADVEAVEAKIPVVPEQKDWAPEIEAVRAEVDAVRKDIPPPADAPDLSDFARKADLETVAKTIPQPKDWTAEIAELRAAVGAIKMPEVVHGVGIADVRKNDDGELILKFTNGETKNVGRIEGRDGMGFDNMDIQWDGERGLTFALRRGDELQEHTFVLPIPVYREVYKRGESYQRGDVTTWGGSAWVALVDTDQAPGENNKDWKLAVKKGQDLRGPAKL